MIITKKACLLGTAKKDPRHLKLQEIAWWPRDTWPPIQLVVCDMNINNSNNNLTSLSDKSRCMSLQLCRIVYVIHYSLQEEIHQEVSLMIPLTTRASNSALVSPSTSRNTGGTVHEMEKDGRNNDSVSPHHDTNVIWEVRNPSTHRRQLLKRGQELQSPEIAADKKKFRDTSFLRVRIQSKVWR